MTKLCHSIAVGFVLALSAATAAAQTAAAPSSAVQAAASNFDETTRPATPTYYGDTGFWFVPTGETLPATTFSFSAFRANEERSQGLFASWGVIRERRTVRGPFFVPDDAVHGGVDPEHPLLRTGWSQTLGAPLTIGAKSNLLSQSRDDALALAIRGTVFFPTGPKEGDTDSVVGRIELVASREAAKMAEVSGTLGGVFRGSPDGFSLSNSLAWGAGVQLPTRSPLRAIFEASGEWMTSDSVTATASFIADDGSVAPRLSAIRSPADFKGGLIWQHRSGFFVHCGFNYSINSPSRVVGGQSFDHSGWAYDVRIGFHPGARS
jgi:hypothetical protein